MGETGVYVGSALQGVDAKGRVVLPADFRTTVERVSSERRILVGFHPLLPCLRAYDLTWSVSERARIARMVEDGVPADEIERQRELAFGDVEPAGFDPSGRFILPDYCRETVEIGEWAFFAGGGETFNIWAPHKLEKELKVSANTRGRCAHMMKNRKVRA